MTNYSDLEQDLLTSNEAEEEHMRAIQEQAQPSKYHRKIKGEWIDVYDITEAYETSHRIHHSVKKLLMAGKRGYKDKKKDLEEAIQSIRSELSE